MVWWHAYIGVQRLPHNVTTYEAIQRDCGLSPIMLSNTSSQADTWVQERWFKLLPSYNLEDMHKWHISTQ